MILKERWTNLDWIFVGIIGVVATVIRSIRLGAPKELVFDEFYYVPDACRFLIQIQDICGPRELTWMHPPLGKWMIGFGMQVLGPTRYGWRLMPVVAGVATIALVYVLARCLFTSRIAAVAAAGLLTFDFLHFLHSRLAMLDIFMTLFVTMGVLFAVIDRDDTTRTGVLRPWRWGAGAALGAAVATKWTAALLLGAVVILTLLWDRRGRTTGNASLWPSLASAAIAFVAIPACVYLISYIGRFDGSILAAPWSDGAWFGQWVQRQQEMFEYHTETRSSSGLLAHPSSSPAWSWLLLKRPMAYYFDARGGSYREVLSMGHVLLWPLAIPALAWLGLRTARLRDSRAAETIVLMVFLGAYVPWLVLTSGDQDPYPYYLLPGIPFMCLAFGAVAEHIRGHLAGRVAIATVALLSVGLWAFYAPVMTASPLSVGAWRARILFHDCAEFPNPAVERLKMNVGPDLPLTGLDRPPRSSDFLFPTGTKATGWCWI